MRTNKTLRTWLAWAGLVLGCALGSVSAQPAAETDLLLRCRFAGTAALNANTNAAKLKKMWTLPAAAELRAEAFAKLAHAGAAWLQQRGTSGFPTNAPAALAQLLEDLEKYGFQLEARGPSGLAAEWVLSVPLPAERAGQWETEWRRLAGGIQTTNTQEWTAKASGAPAYLRFTRVGRWVVVGLGPEGSRLQPRLAAELKNEANPAGPGSAHWLETTADLKRLGWLPEALQSVDWPVAHLVVSNKADVVRSTLRFTFPQPHGWQAEPWQIPTKLISEPLVSFTAAQGLRSFWQQWPALAALSLDPIPNQFVGWAQAMTPFQTYFATPSANGSNQLRRMTVPLQQEIGATFPRCGKVGWTTNRPNLAWTGVPYLTPAVSPVVSGGEGFLIASLFPTIRSTNVVPSDLLAQVYGNTNLAYYDWELSQERTLQWRQLFQLYEIFQLQGNTRSTNLTLVDATTHRYEIANHPNFTGTNYASHRWLDQLVPMLDNCVTEALVTSPREITVKRKSLSGFTGFELVWLTHWIESREFPKWGIIKPNRTYIQSPGGKLTPAKPGPDRASGGKK